MTADVPAGYRLRDARTDDLQHLPAVEQSAATIYFGVETGYVGDGATLALDILDLCRAAGTLWVAVEAGDVPVGFLAATEIDSSLFILELSVARAHQCKGLGRALLEKAINHARWAYLPAVSLITDREIPWNRPFYNRCGFVTLDSTRVSAGIRTKLDAEIASGHDADRRCVMAKLL